MHGVMQRIGKTAWLVCLVLLATALSLQGDTDAPPVLLVYGFQPVPGFRAMQLWEDVAEALSGSDMTEAQRLQLDADHDIVHLPAATDAHRSVFISDFAMAYEPTVRSLFFYTDRFVQEIKFLSRQFGAEQFDVVGHSMGGLIVRTFAEISDFRDVLGSEEFDDYDIVYEGQIRTLITLATPHHGADLAALGQWFSALSRQLAPGSAYLRLLNADQWIQGRLTSLNLDVRYVSLAGQSCLGCGIRPDVNACLAECVDEGLHWQGSDLVIMMSSAYLPEAENTALIGLDHVSMHTHPLVADAIRRILEGEILPSGLFESDLLRQAAR